MSLLKFGIIVEIFLLALVFLLSQGVQIFRVHDVNEINQGILVFNKIILNKWEINILEQMELEELSIKVI